MPGRAHAEGAGLRSERRERPYRAGDACRRSRRASPASRPGAARRSCRPDRPTRPAGCVPPRSTPKVAVDAHTLRCRRVAGAPRGRRRRSAPSPASSSASAACEHVVPHLGHRAEQLGDHALEHRRWRQRALLGPGRLEVDRVRMRGRFASAHASPLSALLAPLGSRRRPGYPARRAPLALAARRAAQAPRRCSPGYPARGRSAHPSPLSTTRLRSRSAVPTIMPDACPLDQTRQRDRQVDPQGVVDERAVAAARRTRTGRRPRGSMSPSTSVHENACGASAKS